MDKFIMEIAKPNIGVVHLMWIWQLSLKINQRQYA
jgi:hypothetical protein